MKPSKPINDWQHIFLDTSFIVDVLSDPARFAKDILVQQRIQLAQRVLEILSTYDNGEQQQRRQYYISAVTISELRKSVADNVAKELVLLFSAADVTFIDFTKDIALLLNRTLDTCLPDGQKYQFIAHLENELKARQYANVRQWVSDDLKIVGSAKSVKKLDVALTSDKNTFKVIADKLEVPCISMFKEDFDIDLFGDISIITGSGRKK